MALNARWGREPVAQLLAELPEKKYVQPPASGVIAFHRLKFAMAWMIIAIQYVIMDWDLHAVPIKRRKKIAVIAGVIQEPV